MTGEERELIPAESMRGPSDWEDEDLLTVVEASDRLGAEITAARERIRQNEELLAADEDSRHAGNIKSALAAERRRLEELITAADRIKTAQSQAPTAT